MKSFSFGLGMLTELCKDHKLIACREHWLARSSLNAFNLVHDEFNFFVILGMDEALLSGFLRGRSFDGVGFLWHKSVSEFVKIISTDPSGRVLALNLNIANKSILILNGYFSCFDYSAIYKADLGLCIDFTEYISDNEHYSDILILGFTNFPCSESNNVLFNFCIVTII